MHKLLSYIRKNSDSTTTLSFIVLVIGIFLRILFLGADPHYYDWIGYITDEGRWIQQARHQTLFGTFNSVWPDLHFVLAPLFQLINYSLFEILGFNQFTTRIFSAISGSLILLLFWLNMKPIVTPHALLAGTTILAFQIDFIALSRLAIPEMSMLLMLLMVYFLLVSNGHSKSKYFLSGLLLLTALGMKGTGAPFFLIFSLMILFFLPTEPDKRGRNQKWYDLLWFWSGFTLPLILVVIIWSAIFSEDSIFFSIYSYLVEDYPLNVFLYFLRPATLYTIVSFPFNNSISPTLNFLSLGLWLTLLAWLASDRHDLDATTNRYLLSSGLWIISYGVLMIVMSYFPNRYKIQLVAPMTIFFTIGISYVQNIGVSKIIKYVSTGQSLKDLLKLAIFCFPTAIFFAPLLAAGMGLLGVDTEPLRVKLFSVLICFVGAIIILYKIREYRRFIGFFLIFPLVGGLSWLVISTTNLTDFWPFEDHRPFFLSRLIFLVLISFISITVVEMGIRMHTKPRNYIAVALVLSYIVLSLYALAPSYINPQFTIRDVSRDLGESLSNYSSIAVDKSEGLFNDNSLKYEYYDLQGSSEDLPEIIVSAFYYHFDRNLLANKYDLIKTYEIYVPSIFFRIHPDTTSLYTKAKLLKVYKKKG